MTAQAKPAVVLLSGGLDSATALAVARRDGFRCHALTIAYGQRHAAELDAARRVAASLGAIEQLRGVAILLKPFVPRLAETIYTSFNFPQAWDSVRYEDVWSHPRQAEELRLVAPLENGKVKPLFMRIV